MKHYVYKLEDIKTGEFYFGNRSCNCKISDDDYMGSYYTWKPEDKSRLVKTILKSNFRKKENAIKYEADIIRENIDNPLNRNYHIPNDSFYRLGSITSDETKEKLRNISLNMSDETKQKIGNTRRGFKHTEAAKQKISKHHKGKEPWNKGKTGVYTEEHKEFLRKKFTGKKYEIITCPHCGKTGGLTGMKSNHFDNCKFKKIENRLYLKK